MTATMVILYYQILQVFFGLIIGLALASYVESFFHQHLGHTSLMIRKLFNRILPSFMNKRFHNVYQGHSQVHHSLTFLENQKDQFTSKFPQHKVDQQIESKGIQLKDVKITGYGTTLDISSFIFFSIPFILVWSPIWILFSKTLSIFCFITFVMMLIPPMFSVWIHPLLHEDYHFTLKKQGLFYQLLRTKYGQSLWKFLWVYHDIHHRSPKYNFNLVIFADYYLRNCAKLPSHSDKIKASLRGGPNYI